jgi:DUF1680 family protein
VTLGDLKDDKRMHDQAARREFLKLAVAGTAMLAHAAPQTAIRARDVPISSTPYTPADYPIRPQAYWQVTLRDNFWQPKINRNAEVTIPFEVRKFSEADRSLRGGVLEAAILSLKTHPDPQLQAQIDARIQELKNSHTRGNGAFEIAATHHLVTGKRDLLDKSIQNAAELYEEFRVKSPPFTGGERDALNCVQLYRVTRERKHLDMAKQYLDIRGLEDSLHRSRHNQSYKPVLEQSEAVGHAVNAVTLMVSLVDVGVLTGIRAYFGAALRMWNDIAASKLYLTGGVGSTGNEGFGEPYSLPNISAYCETCAVLMFITFNHKLFLATGDSKYIDVLERGLYNNAIDGVSVSGDRFFYVNRLSSAGDGRDERWQRASLECCPPNLVRALAGMPGLIYAQDASDAIYVNLYVSSESEFQIGNKVASLAVESEMPWGGKSQITWKARDEIIGTLKLRIPGWARNRPVPGTLYSYSNPSNAQTRLAVNGSEVPASIDKSGYVSIPRNWKNGDTLEIEFPFNVRRVVADERVKENRGRMAVERGPILYCCEWPDVPSGKVLGLLFDGKAELTPSRDEDLFGGTTVIKTKARKISNPALPAIPVKLVPYHLWANRGAGEMSVWLSTEGYRIGDIGPAGGLIFHENPSYAADGWRYLEAAPFDQSEGAKWGCFRSAIPGARGTGIGSGRQNTADMVAACAEPGSAARLCADLNVNGVRGWFLPSEAELELMYRHLKAKGLGNFQDAGASDNFEYWTSSQQTADMAAHIDFADNGRHHGDDKDFPRRVRAVRVF